MITYNHEKYVAQAIESALSQETGFDYEIVVGEDCSTDGTRAIVRNLQREHPNRIRLLLPEKSLGMIPNFVQTFQACRGEYVALLEGDDYWTDPHKLQKQVDFLDAHSEFAICWHPTLRVDGKGSPMDEWPEAKRRKPRATGNDLLESNFIPTASTVFRRGLVGPLPAWYLDVPLGDWALHLLNAQHGDIGCIDQIMACYRMHPGGVHSTLSHSEMKEKRLECYERVIPHLSGIDRRLITRVRLEHYRALSRDYELEGRPTDALRVVAKSFTLDIRSVTKSKLRRAMDLCVRALLSSVQTTRKRPHGRT
jgi:glycosyltransferase involved in cell wall biosynthesis